VSNPPETQIKTYEQRDKRTDARQESNLIKFNLKMWHLMAII